MEKTIKKFLENSRIFKPFKLLQKNKLIIFNYHRIRDDRSKYVFDEGVLGPNSVRFKQEMQWLKKETRILSENELIEMVHSRKSQKELCSMVTFDDGYRDNYDIAFPILKSLRIPAIFFIPTRQINDRQVGWWDIVAYLFKHTKRNNLVFEGERFCALNKDIITQSFNSKLKNLDAEKVSDFIYKLSQSLEVNLPLKALQCSELMTWDQIRCLSNNGMSIGTHTHDHSIMSRQSGDRLKNQVEKSINILEGEIDKKINSISYPVGGYAHFNNESKEISQSLGLQLGFSYLTGYNQMDQIDPFDVRRMSIQPHWRNLDLALAFPQYILKAKSH